MQPLIRADGLTKIVQSGDEPLSILENVTFDVEPGAAVAIVGASGSGKTTLLGLLAGLDRPTAGDVVIDGTTLSSLSEDARAALRARLLGFVFQSFQLLPALTALENVMLPLELANAADATTRARTWLDRVGLGKRTGHYPRQLSGGEQQRVAIASTARRWCSSRMTSISLRAACVVCRCPPDGWSATNARTQRFPHKKRGTPLSTLRLALRLLGRDWRAGELRVLIAALVLAVA